MFWPMPKLSILTYLKIGIGLAVIGYILYLQSVSKKQQQRIEQALIQIGQQQVIIETQQSAIENITRDVGLVLNSIGKLQRDQRELTQDYNRRRNELDSYRGRLAEVSLAKPGLVEKKANQALKQTMVEIKEATDYPTENQ